MLADVTDASFEKARESVQKIENKLSGWSGYADGPPKALYAPINVAGVDRIQELENHLTGDDGPEPDDEERVFIAGRLYRRVRVEEITKVETTSNPLPRDWS